MSEKIRGGAYAYSSYIFKKNLWRLLSDFLLQIFELLAGFGEVATRCLHHGTSARGPFQMPEIPVHSPRLHFPGFTGTPSM